MIQIISLNSYCGLICAGNFARGVVNIVITFKNNLISLIMTALEFLCNLVINISKKKVTITYVAVDTTDQKRCVMNDINW